MLTTIEFALFCISAVNFSVASSTFSTLMILDPKKYLDRIKMKLFPFTKVLISSLIILEEATTS